MPPPTNNPAPTTNLAQAYAELGNVYDPQVAQVHTQQAQVAEAQRQSQASLDQAKANAFSNNSLTSNARGLFFSGYAPQMNQGYVTNTYNPRVQSLNTNTQNKQQSLLDKITAINQERSNAANTLVLNTKQAQAEAAARAASIRSGGGGGSYGRSSGGGKPSQQQVATAISSALAKVTGRDGYVSPNDYAAAYLDWINSGGSTSSFNSNFGRFKNPGNKYYNYAITQAMKRG